MSNCKIPVPEEDLVRVCPKCNLNVSNPFLSRCPRCTSALSLADLCLGCLKSKSCHGDFVPIGQDTHQNKKN